MIRGSTLGLFAGLVCLLGCSDTKEYTGPARHVIFISLDTLRADHLGLYGSDVATPNLDVLAGQSIVFDDMMTAAPTTLASHTSLLTGNYPHTHGTPRNGFIVNEDNVMLAERLAEYGFQSAGFAGSFALSSRFGIAQGFDYWNEDFDLERGFGGRLQNERRAQSVTDSVLAWLDSVEVPDHLFLFVHYFDAHSPYDAPEPYDAMYDPAGREGVPDWISLRQSCPTTVGRPLPIDARVRAQYAAEVSYLDTHVGRLLQGLYDKGIFDEALIVVTSDHGENFWEHNACYDHGWSLYQTTMQAVGIVRLPEEKNAGRRIAEVTATIDWVPSVLRYLEIEGSEEMDGVGVDLSEARVLETDAVRFGQGTKPWESVEQGSAWPNMRKAGCARRGPYKFVHTPYLKQEELYFLDADPSEQMNLMARPSPELRKIAAGLRRELEAWRRSANPLPSEMDPTRRDEMLERLKALGYLGE